MLRFQIVSVLVLLCWNPVSCVLDRRVSSDARGGDEPPLAGVGASSSSRENTANDTSILLEEIDPSSDMISSLTALESSTGRLRGTGRYPSRHRALKSNAIDKAGDVLSSYFERPIDDWSGEQWLILGFTIFFLCCCILPMCNRRRRRYYSPYYNNGGYQYVPAAVVGRNRSVVYEEPPRRGGAPCSQLLWALCCFECCCRDNRDVDCCDMCCCLMCFEVCCRGGADL